MAHVHPSDDDYYAMESNQGPRMLKYSTTGLPRFSISSLITTSLELFSSFVRY
jgi:hypothetical protein